MKNKSLLFLLPLLALACTLSAQATPPLQPQDVRSVLAATIPKPTDKPTASPAAQVCHVTTAGALNLRTCGAMTCPVLSALSEGETLTPTNPQPVDGWLKVKTKGGVTGWVNARLITCP